jgi:uncharacterized protein (UPF0332 family)
MSLRDWSDIGWLQEHKATNKEIRKLLDVASRDIADCEGRLFSDDNRFSISYMAALACAKAALAASGYRVTTASGHYRTIQSLSLTISLDKPEIERFDSYRKKRNESEYVESGLIAESEAAEILEFAKQLQVVVTAWLYANYPRMMG